MAVEHWFPHVFQSLPGMATAAAVAAKARMVVKNCMVIEMKMSKVDWDGGIEGD